MYCYILQEIIIGLHGILANPIYREQMEHCHSGKGCLDNVQIYAKVERIMGAQLRHH